MVLELPPEIETRLEQLAQHEGTTVVSLLAKAAETLYGDDLRYREIVQERIAQADAGQFMKDAEMKLLWNRLLQPGCAAS